MAARTKVRKLPNRKKRFSKGKAIRVSDLVYETLDSSRRGRSWDWLMRRMLGLPDRLGNDQPLIEGMLEQLTGKFFLKTARKEWEDLEVDAYEKAFLTAAKSAVKRVPRPLRMRELP